MAPVSSRSWRGLTFIFCRFLVYLTSTLHVKCFRIQSSRPFITRNVNGMKLDMSDEPVYEYAPRRLPDLWQRDAILSQNSAILVIAGPGSGKTRVMAARLANLLNSGTCRATECLVLSFTSSAATNLLDKTREIMRQNSGNADVATTNGVYCDTFHGFCHTVIQENHHLMEKREFYIASDDDQIKIMSDLMNSNSMPSKKTEVRKILNVIRYWKELGFGFSGVRKNALTSEIDKIAYSLYPRYQSKLKSMAALDFGDLLLNTLRLFRQHPDVLDRYRSRFRHILVDEFQDVSPSQYDILRMLVMGSTSGRFDMAAGGAGGRIAEDGDGDGKSDKLELDLFYSESKRKSRVVNVFCAGDDDQSIYAHRGATAVDSMNRFRFDFPGSRVMKFGVSYRLPDGICKATQSFISATKERIQKPLVSFQTTFTPVGIPTLDMRILEDEDLQNLPEIDFNVPSTRASIEIRGMQHEDDEVNWVVSYLKDIIARAARPQQSFQQQHSSNLPSIIQRDASGEYSVAVLIRFDQRLKALENRLRNDGIPFSSRNFGFGNQNVRSSLFMRLFVLSVALSEIVDASICLSCHYTCGGGF